MAAYLPMLQYIDADIINLQRHLSEADSSSKGGNSKTRFYRLHENDFLYEDANLQNFLRIDLIE